MRDWGVDAEDATLLTSELVTNTVVHAGTRCQLRVRRARDRVRVEVEDENDDVPVPRPCSVDDEHGRGLALVSTLALAWGVDPREHGKVVWFELPR